jgi:hypothetical protein
LVRLVRVIVLISGAILLTPRAEATVSGAGSSIREACGRMKPVQNVACLPALRFAAFGAADTETCASAPKVIRDIGILQLHEPHLQAHIVEHVGPSA